MEFEGKNWRFRVNLMQQLGHVGLVARRVNNFVPDFAGLYLPPIMEDLCKFDQGMILLAGVTGSGKSTTIASMLNWINANYRKHILTLEDPIEFVFTDDKCLVNQREIGLDVKDFEIGMKHAVREDPDVMLVGEMRDRETFMTAIHAAETGHLVFGTIHASSAATTIGRILDLFPADMHSALRSAIAFNMKAIVAQKLLPSIKPGVSRVPTVEVLTFTAMTRKLILEEHDAKLGDLIRMSGREGMQDFTMSLVDLVKKDLVDRSVALEVAPNVDALKNGPQGHCRFATRNPLMLRHLLFAIGRGRGLGPGCADAAGAKPRDGTRSRWGQTGAAAALISAFGGLPVAGSCSPLGCTPPTGSARTARITGSITRCGTASCSSRFWLRCSWSGSFPGSGCLSYCC